MSQSYDAVVIGAGIIGAACAYELARAGLRVAVVEQRGVGTGATNAGMGHLVVLDASPAQFALARYSLELWGEMAERLPPECDYWRCGTLWVAADEEELGYAREKCARYRRNGVRAELLDESQIAEFEPNLRSGLAGGLLIPDDAAVQAASVARFLIEESEAQLISRGAVGIDGDTLLLDDSSRIRGSIVNATGIAAAQLTPGLPIRPRKGQILMVDPGPDFVRHQVVELGYVKSTHVGEQDSIAFNVRQNRNGELLIGSSRQYQADDAEVDAGVLDQLFSRAVEYMPALATARRVRSWAGFRASTPDGLPLIGRDPSHDNVHIATGHEGLGATTSLATARLITAEILGRTPEIDPAPYDPARFTMKSRTTATNRPVRS
jgi:D-hydroxyproline dehydrogenase subunit beta